MLHAYAIFITNLCSWNLVSVDTLDEQIHNKWFTRLNKWAWGTVIYLIPLHCKGVDYLLEKWISNPLATVHPLLPVVKPAWKNGMLDLKGITGCQKMSCKCYFWNRQHVIISTQLLLTLFNSLVKSSCQIWHFIFTSKKLRDLC